MGACKHTPCQFYWLALNGYRRARHAPVAGLLHLRVVLVLDATDRQPVRPDPCNAGIALGAKNEMKISFTDMFRRNLRPRIVHVVRVPHRDRHMQRRHGREGFLELNHMPTFTRPAAGPHHTTIRKVRKQNTRPLLDAERASGNSFHAVLPLSKPTVTQNSGKVTVQRQPRQPNRGLVLHPVVRLRRQPPP